MADGVSLFGPALQAIGSSLASEGDLTRIGAFLPRFQQAAANRQLRGLQAQQIEAGLADRERETQQEAASLEAFNALSPGLFGSEEGRAAFASSPQARQAFLTQRAQSLLPAVETPGQRAARASSEGRLEIAQAAEKRAAAKAERETQERARNRQAQQALFEQLGVNVPTTQQAAAVQPTVSQAVTSISPQPIPPSPGATVTPGPPAMAIDPETKQLAAFQIAGGDMTAGLKTLNDARKEINKQFRPTAKQRSDFGKARSTAAELNRELKRYERLVNKWGFETFDTKGSQAIRAARTNIVLKLKDLHTLGALTGPDQGLLNDLVFDPTLPVEDVTSLLSMPWRMIKAAGTTASERAKLSADQLRDMAKSGIAAQANVLGLSPNIPVLPDPVLPGETPGQSLPQPGPGAVNAAPARPRVRVDINGNVIP